MCVGIALRLVSIDGIVGTAIDGDRPELVDLSLTPDAKPGDWVLSFLGASRSILSQDEAMKIRAALDGLAALMNGGELGPAFADLDGREPPLPPHLQAALMAGQSQG